MIETLYLISGLILPLFYAPQVVRLLNDNSRLESFSLVKALAQLLLRLPALMFAFLVVDNTFMNIVLTADVLGRLLECVVAVISLRRQGLTYGEIAERIMGSLKNSVGMLQRKVKMRGAQKRRAQRANRASRAPADDIQEPAPASIL